MARFRALGANTVACRRPVGHDRPERRARRRSRSSTRPTPTRTRRPTGRRTTRSSAPPQQYGIDGRLHGHRRRAALGRGTRAPGPIRARTSPSWPGSRTPPTTASSSRRSGTRYDGTLHAQGPDRTAARGPLLVDLQRAELRRGPRPAGDQRLDDPDRADDVPRARSTPGWNALQKTGHGQRHDPAAASSPPRASSPARTQEDRRPARQRTARRGRCCSCAQLYCVDIAASSSCAGARPRRSAAPPPRRRAGSSAARTRRCSTPAACRSTRTRRTRRR